MEEEERLVECRADTLFPRKSKGNPVKQDISCFFHFHSPSPFSIFLLTVIVCII